MSQSETEFWAAETARRMTEHNQRALADAARQRAGTVPEPDYGLDGAHATERREYEAMRARQLDESARAHAAAVAEKHRRLGYTPLGEFDFDAVSPVEQAYQHDVDRQARWQQYRATTQAAESGWVRYEQPPTWFK